MPHRAGRAAFSGFRQPANERATGQRDGLHEALDARGHRAYADPEPNDQPWDSDSLTEIAQRLPRLFPRRQYVTP